MRNRLLATALLIQSLALSLSSAQDREPLLGKFDAAFTQYLTDPAAYSKKVESECGIFPEGLLFPYNLVALAWCHQIYRTPSTAPARLPKIETLLRKALASSTRTVKAPQGDFTQLSRVGDHGTFISQLAMALSAYRLAGGRAPDLLKVENHLHKLLVAELTKNGGSPIFSDPGVIWPLDTTTALFAIMLHDRAAGTSTVDPLLQQHHNWILTKGIDSTTGLPASQVLKNGRLAVARGCDLSWRLSMWKELDPQQSQKWYKSYHSQFWKSSAISKGFREWSGDHIKTADLDSGPIMSGVGITATALGVGAAESHSDSSSLAILLAQTKMLAEARTKTDFISKIKISTVDKAWNEIGVSTSRKYLTGFLFGDACAFYGLSWHAYPRQPVK